MDSCKLCGTPKPENGVVCSTCQKNNGEKEMLNKLYIKGFKDGLLKAVETIKNV